MLANKGLTKGWTNAKCLFNCLFHRNRSAVTFTHLAVMSRGSTLHYSLCLYRTRLKNHVCFGFGVISLSLYFSMQSTHKQVFVHLKYMHAREKDRESVGK